MNHIATGHTHSWLPRPASSRSSQSQAETAQCPQDGLAEPVNAFYSRQNPTTFQVGDSSVKVSSDLASWAAAHSLLDKAQPEIGSDAPAATPKYNAYFCPESGTLNFNDSGRPDDRIAIDMGYLFSDR